jgi:hypothetical protein
VQPGGLGDAGADAHHSAGGRGVADGVDARPGVTCGEEQLDAVVGDEPVVDGRPRVVAIVERRQPADRHVDDIHAAVGDKVDHAFDECCGCAAAVEDAGARRHDARTGGDAVHGAAEHVVAGGDACHV